jgi:hypothetical protein
MSKNLWLADEEGNLFNTLNAREIIKGADCIYAILQNGEYVEVARIAPLEELLEVLLKKETEGKEMSS